MESLGEAKQGVNPLWGTPRKTAANGEDITVAYLHRFQNELKYSKRGPCLSVCCALVCPFFTIRYANEARIHGVTPITSFAIARGPYRGRISVFCIIVTPSVLSSLLTIEQTGLKKVPQTHYIQVMITLDLFQAPRHDMHSIVHKLTLSLGLWPPPLPITSPLIPVSAVSASQERHNKNLAFYRLLKTGASLPLPRGWAMYLRSTRS